jgi:hypothetical protein
MNERSSTPSKQRPDVFVVGNWTNASQRQARDPPARTEAAAQGVNAKHHKRSRPPAAAHSDINYQSRQIDKRLVRHRGYLYAKAVAYFGSISTTPR